jgi:hypothetical protein
MFALPLCEPSFEGTQLRATREQWDSQSVKSYRCPNKTPRKAASIKLSVNEPEKFKDGFFAKISIFAFRRAMQAEIRDREARYAPVREKNGYAGLVQDCRDLLAACFSYQAQKKNDSSTHGNTRDSSQSLESFVKAENIASSEKPCPLTAPKLSATQEAGEAVSGVLFRLFGGRAAPNFFKRHIASRRWAAAANAHLTPLAFQWLVGPCRVEAPETWQSGGIVKDKPGRRYAFVERTGVYVEKCRFLEQSSCKGMCTKLCQQPVQKFFTEELGLPLRMEPNFEDFSCKMMFGVAPLPPEEDGALVQSGCCLSDCRTIAPRSNTSPRRTS